MLWSVSLQIYLDGTFPTLLFSGNFQSDCSSGFLFLAGSEILCSKASLSNTRKASQFLCTLQTEFSKKIENVLGKLPMSVSCFINVTLWLHQNRTPQWIFLEECSYFFGDLYLFCEPPNNHYFDRAAQGQLSKYNRRNTISALRTPVKSHKDLKEAESYAKSCSS